MVLIFQEKTKIYHLWIPTVTEHIVPELMITLGYPQKIGKAPPKRPVSELLYFNSWGEKDAEGME